MSFNEAIFSKNNLDLCLRELAKEFRKLNGKSMPAEIILIGGASVLINYGFRDTTYDMDAIIISSSVMKQAIDRVPYGTACRYWRHAGNRRRAFMPGHSRKCPSLGLPC